MQSLFSFAQGFPTNSSSLANNLACVFLNTPPPKASLARLWQSTSGLKIAADGAGDRLRKLQLTPDVIVGDMDSLAGSGQLHRAAAFRDFAPQICGSAEGAGSEQSGGSLRSGLDLLRAAYASGGGVSSGSEGGYAAD